MARLLKKWWPAPLLPLSYYASSKLTRPDSTILDPTQPQIVTRDQFKKGHLWNEFLRFVPVKDGDAAGKLELSIVRYKERLPGRLFHPNFAVDLVSVIHIGDRQYYEKLQERLDNYGCVIFEGVVAECTQNSQHYHDITSLDVQSVPETIRQEAHRFSLVQQADFLKLRRTWKRGDLHWSTIQDLEKERERLAAMTPSHDKTLTSQDVASLIPWPVMTTFLVPFIAYIAFSCNDPVLGSVDMLEQFLKLRTVSCSAAPKFWYAWGTACLREDYENTSGLGKNSVIIGERNKAAMRVLEGEIKRGEHSIAMLYGAGHMPDFHKRLTEEFDLVPTSMDWLTAWCVEEGPKSKYIQPFLNKFPSEVRTLILASLIFATLVAEILGWRCILFMSLGLVVFLVRFLLGLLGIKMK